MELRTQFLHPFVILCCNLGLVAHVGDYVCIYKSDISLFWIILVHNLSSVVKLSGLTRTVKKTSVSFLATADLLVDSTSDGRIIFGLRLWLCSFDIYCLISWLRGFLRF